MPRTRYVRRLLTGALVLALALLASHVAPARAAGHLTVTNEDDAPPTGARPEPFPGAWQVHFPTTDFLSFNRIGTLRHPAGGVIVHDQANLALGNDGDAPLTVATSVSGPFTVAPAGLLTIAPGGRQSVTVTFVAQTGALSTGSLALTAEGATRTIGLAGFWEVQPEKGEPHMPEIAGLFGYTTTIVGPTEKLNEHGLVHAVGDEVLSPYWLIADPSKPVVARQLAGYHHTGQGAELTWFTRSAFRTRHSILHAALTYFQSVLPGQIAGLPPVAAVAFTPTEPFGFAVGSETSDDSQNFDGPDRAQGCPGPCGHHMRFWPIYGADGQRVPDAYLMSMDYAGVNYDYNDDVYVLRNIRPLNGGGPATPCALPCRLDVGRSAGSYTDAQGQVWLPDQGYFTPACAPDEPGNLPADVAGTRDDVLFDTYRGNAACAPPNTRTVTWTIPIPNAPAQVDLNLGFAERYSGNNAPGKRVFSITVNGTVVNDRYDIFQAAGGANRAVTLSLPNVPVSRGSLTVSLRASKDNASLAALEILGPPVAPPPPPPPPPDPGGGTPPPAGPGPGAGPGSPGPVAVTPAGMPAGAPAAAPPLATPGPLTATVPACPLAPSAVAAWVRGTVRVRVAPAVPDAALGHLVLTTAAGGAVSTRPATGAGLVVSVDTRKLPQGPVPLRASLAGGVLSGCAHVLRLQVDNRAPGLVKLRESGHGAERTLSFVPTEPIVLHVSAAGRARTLRAPGGHRLTLRLPSSARAVSLAFSDRAGNHVVRRIALRA